MKGYMIYENFNCARQFFRLHDEWERGRVGEGAKKLRSFSPLLSLAPSPTHRLFYLLFLTLVGVLLPLGGFAQLKCEIVRQEDALREDRIEGYLKELFFVDPNNGWVVGDNGLILRTSDGGKSWTPQKSETQADLWCVYFLDLNRGWAIGARNTILKTDNGGNSWQAPPQASTSPFGGPRLVSMTFFKEKGWIVGDDSTILASSDSGNSWALAGGGQRFRIGDVRRHLNAVQFVNENLGWAAGTNGKLMFTKDGGKEWNSVDLGKYNNLEGLHFVSENEGWVIGQEGAIFHTSDGGKSWSLQKSNTEETLYDVHFFDSKTGIVVGEYGTILYTSDGGTSWQPQKSNTKNILYGLAALDKDHIWATGEWGIVIKIAISY